MTGRTYTVLSDRQCAEARRAVEQVLTGQLEYRITLDDAYKMQVMFRGQARSLRWIARNRPEKLESLMDRPPGSVVFHAITLVYNDNVKRIHGAVVEQYRDHQVRCREALRQSRRSRGLSAPTHRFLGHGGFKPLPRHHLTSETIRAIIRTANKN